MPDEIKPVISKEAIAELTDFYQRLCQYTEENELDQPTATDIADIFWLSAQISSPSPPQSNSSNLETETTKDKENLPEIEDNIEEDNIEEDNIATSLAREKDLIGDYLTPLQPKADKEKEKTPEYPITTPKSKEGKFYIKVPDAPAISQRQELVKIFHQLRRLIPSTNQQDLDIDSTVSEYATTGLLIPKMKCRLIPQSKIALIMEMSDSMIIWSKTFQEFCFKVIRPLVSGEKGTFADLEIWLLTAQKVDWHQDNAPSQPPEAKLFKYRGETLKEYRGESVIQAQPPQQQIIFLVSDCKSPPWYLGSYDKILNLWHRQGLFSLVQLLPERFWSSTGLSQQKAVEFSCQFWGQAPHQWRVEKEYSSKLDSLGWHDVQQQPSPDKLKLPLLLLNPYSTQKWVSNVVKPQEVSGGFLFQNYDESASGEAAPSVSASSVGITKGEEITNGNQSAVASSIQIMKQESRGKNGDEESQKDKPSVAEIYDSLRKLKQRKQDFSAEKLVQLFKKNASVNAIKLAQMLAAVPITLPVVRLIQENLLPEVNTTHIAEVFMALVDLDVEAINQTHKEEGVYPYKQLLNNHDAIEFQFQKEDEDIRHYLLEDAPETHVIKVIDVLSRYIADKLGKTVDEFWALLQEPFSGQNPALLAEILPFAKVSADILPLLGIEEIPSQISSTIKTWENPFFQKHCRDALFQEYYQDPIFQFVNKKFDFNIITVDHQGEITEREDKSAYSFVEMLPGDVPLEMVYIPGGEFIMGASKQEKGSNDSERPQHLVKVSSFYTSKYPITQRQWKAIAQMSDLRVEEDLALEPSYHKDNPENFSFSLYRKLDLPAYGNYPTRWDLPVEKVNWYQAREFTRRLTALSQRNKTFGNKTNYEYVLPSEGQWEYACRGFTSPPVDYTEEELKQGKIIYPPFYFGETITSDFANYRSNYTYANEEKGLYRSKTTPVGMFLPNAFGIYDMHGNVWEWCTDNWHYNYENAPQDGSAWLSENISENEKSKILRGGSWVCNPDICRCAYRNCSGLRDDINLIIGFRVVCVLRRTYSPFSPFHLPENQVEKTSETIVFPNIREERALVSALKTFEFETVKVNRRGEIIKKETKSARYFTEDLGNSVGLDMVEIPGGEFIMGASEQEMDSRNNERPQHLVKVPSFYMSKYPITQRQWKAIAQMSDLRVDEDLSLEPSYHKDNPGHFAFSPHRSQLDLPTYGNNPTRWDLPVEQVNWYQAREFTLRLTALSQRNKTFGDKTNYKYLLPSEGQWEYTCRGFISPPVDYTEEELKQGKIIYPPFYFGDTITSDLANYNGNKIYAGEEKGLYRGKTTPVGMFPPNAFGLYDLHGNVWEWCADNWYYNYRYALNDCSARLRQNSKTYVIRGGSLFVNPLICRSASRNYNPWRDVKGAYVGFRVVCGLGRN